MVPLLPADVSDGQDRPDRKRLGREGRREIVRACPLPIDNVDGQDLPDRIEVPGLVSVRKRQHRGMVTADPVLYRY